MKSPHGLVGIGFPMRGECGLWLKRFRVEANQWLKKRSY
jgi:hypothetical protein